MRGWLVAVLALFSSPMTARDWYLSPLGNDGASGSEAQPLRTISRLLDPSLGLLSPGDRLILRAPAGNTTFAETELRLRLRLTLMAFPGESPKIVCPLNLDDGVCIQIDPAASGSVISGLDIAGGNLYGIFLQTDWEQGANANGQGASNILIEDCKVHDTGRDAIKITPKSNNATIRRCEIYNSGRIYPPGTPLEDRNAEGIDNVQGSGMKVQDSHVHDTSTNGIYFKGGASDVVIERNRVERTGEAGILVGFDTSPEFFDLAQNPQYYEAVRGVVRNNIVRDTDYAGIGLYASRDAVVANNTLINTARVGHGALYFGVTLQDFDPIAGRPANVSPRILNNLVQQTTSRGPCVSIRFANELGGLSGLSGASGIDYSLFGSSTGCRFFDQRPGSVLDEGGSFAQWRQAALADAHSSEGAVALTADGHLTAGASAIGAGTTLTEVADDFDHQARTAPVDIGADEFATAGGVSADEPAFSAIALPLPAPAFPNCPGGYFVATIDDGPAPGLSPGIFGFDLTLNAPGTQRLEGGLNFGGSLDGSQVAFAGFNIQNTANEPQGLDLRLNGNPASSQDGTLPVRIKVFRQASAGVNELVFEAAASLSIAQAYTAALTLNPGFHVVTVAPEGAASVPGGSADGQVYVSLGSQFVGRPGGGFFGGVVVGGYHAAPPFGDNSGFASFCLGSAHAATAHVLSAPTYGATGAHDLRLRILDHLRREVIVVP